MNEIFSASTIIIKVRHVRNGELIARKLVVSKNIKLDEFHKEIRSRFGIGSDVVTELHYKDEDNDRVIITFEDEFLIALKSNPPAKFELVVVDSDGSRVAEIPNVNGNVDNEEAKRFIKARITYPEHLAGSPGDYNEVVFKSKDLTLDKSAGNHIWGTKIYTNDSNYLEALLHSHPVQLTENPPSYNVIATFKILPGQTSYLGSYCNGVNSQDYTCDTDYNGSFSIEDIRYEKI